MNSFPMEKELTIGIKSNITPRLTAVKKLSTFPLEIFPDCNAPSTSRLRKRNDVFSREP